MNKILDKLGIDETLTKPSRKDKVFTKVRNNIPLKEDYNFMADLLFLPKTKKGFRYLLVVVDLATKEFDIEPLKTKQSTEVLKAMKVIFNRKYLNKPYASIQTDDGSEFKGVFHKYMYNESILHKQTVPGRHSQMSMVESLNRQLGRLFNGYMNKKEVDSNEQYNEWTDILSAVRELVNEHRKVELPKNPKYEFADIETLPKYKVGDVVLYKLDKPRNSLNREQGDEKFREGDLRWSPTPKKIMEVFSYSKPIPYRYRLAGLKNVSFTESQLKPSKEKDTRYEIKSIIGERTRSKQKEYLVWWKNYLKRESTWQPEKGLIEDIGNKRFKEYVKEFKEKEKKKN